VTTETAGDDFVSLRPTIVLKRIIPDHEEANLVLIELITEHDRSRTDMTTEYLRVEFLSESGRGGAWGRSLLCLSRRNPCGGPRFRVGKVLPICLSFSWRFTDAGEVRYQPAPDAAARREFMGTGVFTG